MPTLGSLAAGLTNITSTRRSEAYITELGDDDRPIQGEGGFQNRRFQYFPETLQDTKAVNYQTREVPGGSLPLYQYVNSGERLVTFTAFFTTDVDHYAGSEVNELGAAVTGLFGDQRFAVADALRTTALTGVILQAQTRLQAAGVLSRNPFVPGALVWLRRFMLPRYGEASDVGVPLTKPPHKLLLNLGGVEIERLGGDGSFSAPGGGINCVMTQCDITIEALFPTGNIRIATVSLGFAEVPQQGGMVRFPSASGLDELTSWYGLSASVNGLTSTGSS
jgi:hypothetical protein